MTSAFERQRRKAQSMPWHRSPSAGGSMVSTWDSQLRKEGERAWMPFSGYQPEQVATKRSPRKAAPQRQARVRPSTSSGELSHRRGPSRRKAALDTGVSGASKRRPHIRLASSSPAPSGVSRPTSPLMSPSVHAMLGGGRNPLQRFAVPKLSLPVYTVPPAKHLQSGEEKTPSHSSGISPKGASRRTSRQADKVGVLGLLSSRRAATPTVKSNLRVSLVNRDRSVRRPRTANMPASSSKSPSAYSSSSSSSSSSSRATASSVFSAKAQSKHKKTKASSAASKKKRAPPAHPGTWYSSDFSGRGARARGYETALNTGFGTGRSRSSPLASSVPSARSADTGMGRKSWRRVAQDGGGLNRDGDLVQEQARVLDLRKALRLGNLSKAMAAATLGGGGVSAQGTARKTGRGGTGSRPPSAARSSRKFGGGSMTTTASTYGIVLAQQHTARNGGSLSTGRGTGRNRPGTSHGSRPPSARPPSAARIMKELARENGWGMKPVPKIPFKLSEESELAAIQDQAERWLEWQEWLSLNRARLARLPSARPKTASKSRAGADRDSGGDEVGERVDPVMALPIDSCCVMMGFLGYETVFRSAMCVSKAWFLWLTATDTWRSMSLSGAQKTRQGMSQITKPRAITGPCSRLTEPQFKVHCQRWALLVHADLTGCINLKASALASLGENCPLLETLCLARCEGVDDEALHALLVPRGGSGRPRLRWEEESTSSSDEYEEDGEEDGVFRWKDENDGADLERENSVSRSRTYSKSNAAVGKVDTKDRGTCSLSNLHSLDLSHCEAVTSEGIATVASTLRDKLSDLNLTRCRRVGTNGLEALATHCSSLQTLHLSWCTVDGQGLSSLAGGCTELRSLFVRWCKEVTDTGVLHIVRACRQLQTLVLDHCTGLTDLSALHIAQHAQRIETLSLTYCKQLTGRAAAHLLAGCCSKLQVLCLDHCDQVPVRMLQQLLSASNLPEPVTPRRKRLSKEQKGAAPWSPENVQQPTYLAMIEPRPLGEDSDSESESDDGVLWNPNHPAGADLSSRKARPFALRSLSARTCHHPGQERMNHAMIEAECAQNKPSRHEEK